MSEHGEVIKRGWLFKKMRTTRKWKRRFFIVLEKNGMVFFQARTKWSGKKTITVHSSYYLDSETAISGHFRDTMHGRVAFQLVTRDPSSSRGGGIGAQRNCELALPTREEAEEWRDAILASAASRVASTPPLSAQCLAMLTEEERVAIIYSASVSASAAGGGAAPFVAAKDSDSAATAPLLGVPSPRRSLIERAAPSPRPSAPALALPASLEVMEEGEALSSRTTGWRLLHVDGGARLFTPSDERIASDVFASGSRGRTVLKVVAAVGDDPSRVFEAYTDLARRSEWDPSYRSGEVLDGCGDEPMEVVHWTTHRFSTGGWPFSMRPRSFTVKQHWRKDVEEETYTITGISDQKTTRIFQSPGARGGCCASGASAGAPALLDEVLRIAPSCSGVGSVLTYWLSVDFKRSCALPAFVAHAAATQIAAKIAGLCAFCRVRDVHDGDASALRDMPTPSSSASDGDGDAASSSTTTSDVFSYPFRSGEGGEHCWKETITAWKVRGPDYLSDGVKVPSENALAKCVGIHLLGSNTARIDHVAARPNDYLAALSAEKGANSPFHLVVSLQFPGPPHFSIAFFFELPFIAADFENETVYDADAEEEEEVAAAAAGGGAGAGAAGAAAAAAAGGGGDGGESAAKRLLRRFINESDEWRDSRLKLIPSMAEASWWIKSLVGSKPALIGKKLTMAHHRGSNYLELDLDIGSSVIAQNIVGQVRGSATLIAADIAFVIQGQSGVELPECVVGEAQLCRLDFERARWID